MPHLAARPKLPRDLVFVIDRSGSMEGKKIEQARAALLAGLATLAPDDRFDIVSFASDIATFGRESLLTATRDNLDRARDWSRSLDASGATDLDDALWTALQRFTPDPKRFEAIVLLTDGDPTSGVTDPDRILAKWNSKCGAVRLFAFGVGDDVKDFLLTKLATQGRGEARYVREGENLEVALSALFDRVRTPLLTDPVLTIDGGGEGRSGGSVTIDRREPQRLPDLFQGRPLVVSGRYHGAGPAVIHLRGRSGEESVSIDVPVDFPETTPARPHLAQLWAKSRVERLLDEMRCQGGKAEIEQEIRALGLAHQLVTPYTSFLVVEQDAKLADAAERALDDGSAEERLPTSDHTVDRNSVPLDPDDPTGGTPIGVGSVGHRGSGTPSAFAGRSAGGGGTAGGGFRRNGATSMSSAAVATTVDRLVRQQLADGSWSHDDLAAPNGDVETTSFAVLALLGEGATLGSSRNGGALRRGADWLVAQQEAEGGFGPAEPSGSIRRHVFATLALAELTDRIPTQRYEENLGQALRFVLQRRTAKGGWNFADGRLDLESTAWMALVIETAAHAALTTPKLAVDSVIRHEIAAAIDAITDAANGRITTATGADQTSIPDTTATAMGAVVRLLAGHWSSDDPTLAKAAEFLATLRPAAADAAPLDGDRLFFTTLAATRGFDPLKSAWNDVIKSELLDRKASGTDAALGRTLLSARDALTVELYFRYPQVVGTRR